SRVEVFCRPVRLSGPKRKERCTFECEFVSILRSSNAIQEALNRIPAEHSLIVLASALGERKKSCSNGCRQVPCRSRFHKASMYGRMTLPTRQTLAQR